LNRRKLVNPNARILNYQANKIAALNFHIDIFNFCPGYNPDSQRPVFYSLLIKFQSRAGIEEVSDKHDGTCSKKQNIAPPNPPGTLKLSALQEIHRSANKS